MQAWRNLSTFSRIALGIVAGFVVLHLSWLAYYGHERMVESAGTFASSVAERALALKELQAELGASHPDLLATLQNPLFKIRISPEAPVPPEHLWPHNAEIQSAVAERLLALGYHGEFKVWYDSGHRGPPVLVFATPMTGGEFLEIRANTRMAMERYRAAGVFWTTAMLVLVVLIVLFATRRVTGLLPAFVSAAESVGVTDNAPPLPEDRGPREIRRASRAFNEMRARVHHLLEERGDMLAAMSHDLRTIATRLQLRSDFIEDATQRNKAVADLGAMTTILDEALAYAREEHSQEPRARVDLLAILERVVADEQDLGSDATLQVDGVADLIVTGQPVALQRAFTNLVRNAVEYGGSVQVVVAAPDQVRINDPGEGLDADAFASMTRPYRRGDASRNRGTGGTGLGLAIARRVIERHGGRLMSEQTENGFSVIVDLGVR